MTGTLRASAMPRCSLDRWLAKWHCLNVVSDVLAHSYQPIISSHHQQAVIGAAAQEAEDSCPQISFMAGQISEAYYFCLRDSDITTS